MSGTMAHLKVTGGAPPSDGSSMKTSGEPVASEGMFVVNRKGQKEPVQFDQILHRVQRLCFGLHPLVDPARVSQAVIKGMFNGIKTTELDELAAQTSGRYSVTFAYLKSWPIPLAGMTCIVRNLSGSDINFINSVGDELCYGSSEEAM